MTPHGRTRFAAPALAAASLTLLAAAGNSTASGTGSAATYRAFPFAAATGVTVGISAMSPGGTIAGPFTLAAAGNQPAFDGTFTWDGQEVRSYRTIDLTPSIDAGWTATVTGVNDAGVVTGYESQDAMTSSGLGTRYAPVVFSNDAAHIVPLGIADSETADGANAVNNHGAIVGSDSSGIGFLLDSNLATTQIPALAEASFGASVSPAAINARGDIAGTSSVVHTFRNALDAKGTLPVHVFLMTGSGTEAKVVDRGVVPGCDPATVRVTGIDDSDRVTGTCQGDNQTSHAWIWDGMDTRMLPDPSGDDSSAATAMAPGGDIVGWAGHGDRHEAVLWHGSGVVTLDSLVDAAAKWQFSEAVGISARGWIVGKGSHAGSATEFVLAPVRDAGAASDFAAFPSVAMQPPAQGPPNLGSPAPSPASPDVPIVIATPPASSAPIVRPLWTATIAALPGTDDPAGAPSGVASDGKTVYVSQAGSVAAFTSAGAPLWKSPIAGDPQLLLAGSALIADGANGTAAIDVATGKRRWSIPHAAETGAASLASDGTTFAIADFGQISTFSLDSGTPLAHARSSCENIVAADGSVACTIRSDDYSVTLNGFDARTLAKKFSLGVQTVDGTGATTVYADDHNSLLSIHPGSGTFDAFAFPLPPDVNRHFLVAPPYVYVVSSGTVSRFRLDRDPAKDRALTVSIGDPAWFGSRDDAFFARDPKLGLEAVTFDATGKPESVAFPAYRTAPNAPVAVAGGIAFVALPKRVDLVDYRARRVDGSLVVSCGALDAIAVTPARVAYIACRPPQATTGPSRLYAIALTASPATH